MLLKMWITWVKRQMKWALNMITIKRNESRALQSIMGKLSGPCIANAGAPWQRAGKMSSSLFFLTSHQSYTTEAPRSNTYKRDTLDIQIDLTGWSFTVCNTGMCLDRTQGHIKRGNLLPDVEPESVSITLHRRQIVKHRACQFESMSIGIGCSHGTRLYEHDILINQVSLQLQRMNVQTYYERVYVWCSLVIKDIAVSKLKYSNAKSTASYIRMISTRRWSRTRQTNVCMMIFLNNKML